MSCKLASVSLSGVWIAQAFYLLCLVPQIWTNYKNKNGQGLSDFLLLGYFNSYICELYYTFSYRLPSAYQILCPLQAAGTVVLVAQRLYYSQYSEVKWQYLFYGLNVLIGLMFLPTALHNPASVGLIAGWGMFTLTFIEQIPQIFKIFKEKSVVGFSILFVILTLLAASIELITALIFKLPIQTLLSAFRSVIVSCIWIIQFCIYQYRPYLMLNRDKLLNILEQISSTLFAPREENQILIAEQEWTKLSADKTFIQKVEESESSFLLPRWQEDLSEIYAIKDTLNTYTVLGVDGSQVYPDRHISGIGCCLVNTGGCLITYGTQSAVQLFSEPRIFLPEELASQVKQDAFSTDLIDLKRESCEFATAFEQSLTVVQNQPKTTSRFPFVCLFDGSLIFWHLEGSPPEVKNYFLQNYLSHMQQFYDHAILMAGYISMPKSRELVNLIRLGLCRFDRANCIPCHSHHTNFPCKAVDSVLDTHLCSILLKQNTRTTIFYSTSKITDHYPAHLKPCFFYLDIGSEIVRLEMPFWQSNDPTAIELICQVAINQTQKGYGYPVVLAEAHEQAVIHSHDRSFFYHLMHKRSIEHNRKISMSPKSIKKKGIGI